MSREGSKFSSATIDDIKRNPSSFGAPTFEEFKRNREKYLGRDDEALAQVQSGSVSMKNQITKYVYEIEGYRCKTLEEIERVAASQGIPMKDLDYRPQLVQLGGGRYEAVVKFVSKHERQRREREDNGNGKSSA